MEIFSLVGRILVNSGDAEKSISSTGKKAESLGSKLGEGIKTAAKWGTAIVGAAAGVATGFVAAAKATSDYGSNINDMSQKIGISADAYQQWDYVMSQCGASVDSLKVGMKTLSTQAQGNAKEFQELGISQQQVASMSKEELLQATIDGLAKMEDGTKRTAIASKLLGKAGADMGSLLNQGTDAINAQMEQAKQYGLVMSNDAVEASDNFGDSLELLKGTFGGLKNKMMAEFLPALTKVTDGLSKLLTGDTSGLKSINDGIGEFVKKITDVLPKMMELGGSILSSLAKAILDNLPKLIDAAVQLITTLAKGIIDNLPKIVDAALQIILTLADAIADDLPELIPTIVDVVIQIVETLTDNVDKLVDAAIAIMTALAEGLIDALPTLIDKAPEIITKLVQALVDNVPKLIDAAVQIIEQLAGYLTDPDNQQKMWDAAKEIIKALIDGINELGDALGEAGIGIINDLWDGLKEQWNQVVTWFQNAWRNLVSGKNLSDVISGKSSSGAAKGSNRGSFGSGGGFGGTSSTRNSSRGRAMSHASGLAYVPYDDYPASLHRGETVLNAADTAELLSNIKALTSGSGGTQTITVHLDLDGETIATKVINVVNRRTRSVGSQLVMA
jgi:predicted PurR-regulated permease PerM